MIAQMPKAIDQTTPQMQALLSRYTREHCIDLLTADPAGVDRLLDKIARPKHRQPRTARLKMPPRMPSSASPIIA